MSVCSNEAKVGSRIAKAQTDAYEVLLPLLRDPKADRELCEWKCENYSSRLVCSSGFLVQPSSPLYKWFFAIPERNF